MVFSMQATTVLTLVLSAGFCQSFSVFGPSAIGARQSQLNMEPPEGEKRRRFAEFANLEPLEESDLRKERLEREEQNRQRFAEFGNELWDLRSGVQELSGELIESINCGDDEEEESIRNALIDAEARDPELTYKLELEAMVEAEDDGRHNDYFQHREDAINARSCLPHFNLEGLWVGK